MIVCVRTVGVPPEARDGCLALIADGRATREPHGILAEWVLETGLTALPNAIPRPTQEDC